ncbi:hypothetical protein B0H16DRAFT_1474815 [Mycena metata]|uniref:Uncharacterized protein n=1 Tax=Mycena metata TaxID=1033252 RepID=A0AAD7MIX4_9AGAR|nr:hypothetical protein B0H16DRAFT_1474815 [Mycena metata]
MTEGNFGQFLSIEVVLEVQGKLSAFFEPCSKGEPLSAIHGCRSGVPLSHHNDQATSPARSYRSCSPSSDPSDSTDDYERTEAEKQRAHHILVNHDSDDNDDEQDDLEFAHNDVAMETFEEEEGAGSKRGEGGVESQVGRGQIQGACRPAETVHWNAAVKSTRNERLNERSEYNSTKHSNQTQNQI